MKTTTDLLTFFQPGRTAGTTWSFTCPNAYTPREAWTYLPGEADLSRFRTREISSEDQFNQLLEEVRAAIRDGGGILAEAKVHNEFIKVSLEGKEAAGYEFPRRMLRLRASGDPRHEDVSESVDLLAGDHLILPVSATAQERLESFDGVFEGFPDDVRSTILNVLRRPSLEWRINRIEQILSMPPATPAEWEKSRLRSRSHESILERLSRWFMWRIPIGPVVAGLLLLGGGLAGYHRFFGEPPAAAEAARPATGVDAAGAASASAVANPRTSDPNKRPPQDTGTTAAPRAGAGEENRRRR